MQQHTSDIVIDFHLPRQTTTLALDALALATNTFISTIR